MRIRGKKGFTIIEVTVAMALVAGLALTVSELISWQNKSARSIASVMDRNELQDKVRAMLSNAISCPTVFGAGQSTPIDFTSIGDPSFPISAIYDPNDTGRSTPPRVLLSMSKPPAGFTMKILGMSLDNTGALPDSSGLNTRYYKKFVIKAEKVKDVASATNPNPTPSYAVGGNAMKPIEVELVVTVDAQNHIAGCSFDNGTGAYTCDIGEHLAGTVMGRPKCCAAGKFLKSDGTCAPATATVCNIPGEYPLQVSDMSATCCKNAYAEDPSGGSGNAAHLTCPGGTFLNSATAGCWHNDKFQWLRYGPGSNNYNNLNGPNTEATARCASDGVKIYGTCCRVVYVVPPKITPTPPPCTPDLFNGLPNPVNACISESDCNSQNGQKMGDSCVACSTSAPFDPAHGCCYDTVNDACN